MAKETTTAQDAAKAGQTAVDAAKGVKTIAKAATQVAAQDYVGAAVELIKNPKAIAAIISIPLAILIVASMVISTLFAGVYNWLFETDKYSIISEYNSLTYKINQESLNKAYKYTSNEIMDELCKKGRTLKLVDKSLNAGKDLLFKDANTLKGYISKGSRQVFDDSYIQGVGYSVYAQCKTGAERFFPIYESSDVGYENAIDRSSEDLSEWTETYTIVDMNNKDKTQLTTKTDDLVDNKGEVIKGEVIDYTSSPNKALYSFKFDDAKFYQNSESIIGLYNVYKAYYTAFQQARCCENIAHAYPDETDIYSFISQEIDDCLKSDKDSGGTLAYTNLQNYIRLYYGLNNDDILSKEAIGSKIYSARSNMTDVFIKCADKIDATYKESKIDKDCNGLREFLLASSVENTTNADGTSNEIYEDIEKQYNDEVRQSFISFMGDENTYKNLFTFKINQNVETDTQQYKVIHNATNDDANNEEITINNISRSVIFSIHVDFCDYDQFVNLIYGYLTTKTDEGKTLVERYTAKSVDKDTDSLDLKISFMNAYNSINNVVGGNRTVNQTLETQETCPLMTSLPRDDDKDGVYNSSYYLSANNFVKVDGRSNTSDDRIWNCEFDFNDTQKEFIKSILSNQSGDKRLLSYRTFWFTDLNDNYSVNIDSQLILSGGSKIAGNVGKDTSSSKIVSFSIPKEQIENIKGVYISVNATEPKKDGDDEATKLKLFDREAGFDFYFSPLTKNSANFCSGKETVELYKVSSYAETDALSMAGYASPNMYIQYRMKIANMLFGILSVEDTKMDFFVDPDNIATDENGKQMISDGYYLSLSEESSFSLSRTDEGDKNVPATFYFVTVKPSTVVYLPFSCETTQNKLSLYSSKTDPSYNNLWNRFWGRFLHLDWFNAFKYTRYMTQTDMSTYSNTDSKNMLAGKIRAIDKKNMSSFVGNSVNQNYANTEEVLEGVQLYTATKENVGVSYYEFRDSLFGYTVANVQTSQYIGGTNKILTAEDYKNSNGAAYLLDPDRLDVDKTYNEYYEYFKSKHSDLTEWSDIEEPIILGHTISSQCLTKDTTLTGKAYKENDKSTYPVLMVSVGYLDSYSALLTGTDPNQTAPELKLEDVFDLSTVDDAVYKDPSTGFAWSLVGGYETSESISSRVDGTVVDVKQDDGDARGNYVIIQSSYDDESKTATRTKITGITTSLKKDDVVKANTTLIGEVRETSAFNAYNYECTFDEKTGKEKPISGLNPVSTNSCVSQSTKIKIDADSLYEDSNGKYAKVVSAFKGVISNIDTSNKTITIYSSIEEKYCTYENVEINANLKLHNAVSAGTLIGKARYDKSKPEEGYIVVSVYEDGNSETNVRTTPDKDNSNKLNVANDTTETLYFKSMETIKGRNTIVFENRTKTKTYTYSGITGLGDEKYYTDVNRFQMGSVIGYISGDTPKSEYPTLLISHNSSSGESSGNAYRVYYSLVDFFPSLDDMKDRNRNIVLEYLNADGKWTPVSKNSSSVLFNPKGPSGIPNENTLQLRARLTLIGSNTPSTDIAFTIKDGGGNSIGANATGNVVTWKYGESEGSPDRTKISIFSQWDNTEQSYKSGNIIVTATWSNNKKGDERITKSSSVNIYIPSVLQTLTLDYKNPSTGGTQSSTGNDLWYLDMNKILSNKTYGLNATAGKNCFDIFSVKMLDALNSKGGKTPTVNDYKFEMANNDYFEIVNSKTGTLKWKRKYLNDSYKIGKGAPTLILRYNDPDTKTERSVSVRLYPVNTVTEFKSLVASDQKQTINKYGTAAEKRILIYDGDFRNSKKENLISFSGDDSSFSPTFIQGNISNYLTIKSAIRASDGLDWSENFKLTYENGKAYLSIKDKKIDTGVYTVTLTLKGNAKTYVTNKEQPKTASISVFVSHGVSYISFDTNSLSEDVNDFGIFKTQEKVNLPSSMNNFSDYCYTIFLQDYSSTSEHLLYFQSLDKNKKKTSAQFHSNEYTIERMSDDYQSVRENSNKEPWNCKFKRTSVSISNGKSALKIFPPDNHMTDLNSGYISNIYRISIDETAYAYLRVILLPPMFDNTIAFNSVANAKARVTKQPSNIGNNLDLSIEYERGSQKTGGSWLFTSSANKLFNPTVYKMNYYGTNYSTYLNTPCRHSLDLSGTQTDMSKKKTSLYIGLPHNSGGTQGIKCNANVPDFSTTGGLNSVDRDYFILMTDEFKQDLNNLPNMPNSVQQLVYTGYTNLIDFAKNYPKFRINYKITLTMSTYEPETQAQ
ncbi:MAG: hypothetical protein UH542_00805 [Bacteroidales bacterium]|nr:hypothetical protein [Bacteroidales bacterium]